MSQKIYLLEPGGSLTAVKEAEYQSEDLLKELLAKYPDLLAGDQMSERDPRRWLLISREYGVPDGEDSGNRWAVDHLFVDQYGTPTLVEVKGSSDTRLRREVVGQMLDYAAHAVAHWSAMDIRTAFENRCSREGCDPAAELLRFLERGEEDREGVGGFWNIVETNLRAGKIRMVFVADRIPPELQRTVEFLDEQMDAEVLAVEVRQFAGDGRRLLVPRMIGQTAAAQGKGALSAASPRPSPWTAQELLQRIENAGRAVDAEVVRRILDWADTQRLEQRGGLGSKAANLYFCVQERGGKLLKPLYIYDDARAVLTFDFKGMGACFSDQSRRAELANRLAQATGIQVDPQKQYPSIRLDSVRASKAIEGLLDVLSWLVGEMRQNRSVVPA